jgi:hypothetical protein
MGQVHLEARKSGAAGKKSQQAKGEASPQQKSGAAEKNSQKQKKGLLCPIRIPRTSVLPAAPNSFQKSRPLHSWSPKTFCFRKLFWCRAPLGTKRSAKTTEPECADTVPDEQPRKRRHSQKQQDPQRQAEVHPTVEGIQRAESYPDPPHALRSCKALRPARPARAR